MGMTERETERILKAFANKRRVMIVKHLARARRASVGDIATQIKLSVRATSKHLSILAGAGILDREQVGLTVWYFLSPTAPKLVRVVVVEL